MRLLDGAEARAIDRVAIERLGLPGLVLMENAAIAVAEVIERRFPRARRVAIACGGGNNGGDGLALARQLATRGVRGRRCCSARAKTTLRGDAAVQLRALRAAARCERRRGPGDSRSSCGASTRPRSTSRARRWRVPTWWSTRCSASAFQRPIAGWRAAAGGGDQRGARASPRARPAERTRRRRRARCAGPHVRAEVTVTFFAPKRALVLLPAGEAAGEVWSAPLGVPDRGARRACRRTLRLVTAADLDLAAAPARRRTRGASVIW